MARKTLIFGNGLGMALDANAFSLDTAIQSVWNDSGLLSEAHRLLICSCLPEPCKGYPHGEEDMDTLHMALSACDVLKKIQSNRRHWLSVDGRGFPEAVRGFLYNVAIHFHQTNCKLPLEFIDPLVEFIKGSKSHIATLNYDDLLYTPFINYKILSGYSGKLVDGFHHDGFDKENMSRKYGRSFGYYLHLHGSPLYVSKPDKIVKLSRLSINPQAGVLSSNIVLTHVKHKPSIINASKVLSAYWSHLKSAILESEEVILFGYSGADTHLNELLKNFIRKNPVRIVEWGGNDDFESRKAFWKKELGVPETLDLIHLQNILEFTDWS